MNNSFKIICGEEEITLLKKDVEFINGYGIVHALFGSYDDDDNFQLTRCIGIVDQNYEEVIPLIIEQNLLDILILAKGNILLKVQTENSEDILHFTFKGSQAKFCAELNCVAFFQVDNNLVQLQNNEEAWARYALYDVNNKKLLSDYYSVIGSFIYNSEFKEEIALANSYILNEDGNVIDIISTFINKKGKILKPFKSLSLNIELQSSNLKDAQEEIYSLINGKGRKLCKKD